LAVLAFQAPAAPASFDDLALSVTPPALSGLEQHLGAKDDNVRGTWTGGLGACDVQIALFTFPLKKWGFGEAGGVTVVMLDWLRKKGDFDVDESFEREGKYGASPVLSVVAGRIREQGQVVGREYAASGLLSEQGYSFHVRVRPEP